MQFKLPELGEGVHEGELVKWQVKPRDSVGYDQPLCEIMTDKATVEIPSAFKGKVAALNAKEGEVVKVGQVMLTFEGSAAAAATPETHAPAAAPMAAAPVKPAAPAQAAPATPAPSGSSGNVAIESRPLAA